MSTYTVPNNSKNSSHENDSKGNKRNENDNSSSKFNSFGYCSSSVTSLPLPPTQTDPAAPSISQAHSAFELQSHRPSLQNGGHISTISPHNNTSSGILSEQLKCSPAISSSHSGFYLAQDFNQSDNDIVHDNIRGPEERKQQSWNLDSSTPCRETRKANRLRKACDSCSIRKVKCDESGPPCRACTALEIPCTYNRPSRRRGPPNRHIETIKRRRLENQGTPTIAPVPISSDSVVASLAPFCSHTMLNAESICPISILKFFVDDFYTFLYPICPFPRETSFRAAFKDRDDLRDLNYLALLASMMEVTVLSLPRRSQLHFSTQSWENPPPSILGLADCCHKVAVEARGAGYLEKDLNIYDAITSYFLGLAASYNLRWNQTKLYFGEALTIARIVGEFKSQELHSWPDIQHLKVYETEETQLSKTKDLIKQEIARRVFWVLFVRIRSMQQFDSQLSDLLIPPPTPTDPYPPLPLEVDDKYIFVDRIDSQPSDYSSSLIGINLSIKIYVAITPLAKIELARGVGELFDWKIQKNTIEECFFNLNQLLNEVPQLLRLESSHPVLFNSDKDKILSPYSEVLQLSHQCKQDDEIMRKAIQLEVQKINIYASQIASRCHLLERYRILFETYKRTYTKQGESLNLDTSSCLFDKDTTRANIMSPDLNDVYLNDVRLFDEWKIIIKDFLDIICLLNANILEAIGRNLLIWSKRDRILMIISIIISSPRSYFGSLAPNIQDSFHQFLDMLIKYECAETSQLKIFDDTYLGEAEEDHHFWIEFRKLQENLTQVEKIFNG